MSRNDRNNETERQRRIRKLVEDVEGIDKDVNINLPIDSPPPPQDEIRRLIRDRDNTGAGKTPRIDVPPLTPEPPTPTPTIDAEISASPTVLPPDGKSTSTLTIQIISDGQQLNKGIGTLQVGIGGIDSSGNKGSISNVTNNNDGTYTATYTAGTEAGPVNIQIKDLSQRFPVIGSVGLQLQDDEIDIDPFVPNEDLFQLYKRFQSGDINTAQRQRITGGAWSKGQKVLDSFYTSSEQTSASSSLYYYNIYDEDPAKSPDTAEIQFSLSYGHVTGGAAPSVFDDNQSPEPTKAVYKQLSNILLDAVSGNEKFQFNGYDSDDFYAILLSRDTIKDKVRPGSWQINLQSGSQEWTFTDSSYISNPNSSDFKIQQSYPIVSASLDVVPFERNYEITRNVDKGELMGIITELADNDALEIEDALDTSGDQTIPQDSEKKILSQSIWMDKISSSAYPELRDTYNTYSGQINSSLWTDYSQSYNDVHQYLFVSESSPSLTNTGSNPGFLSKMNERFDFSGSESTDNPLSVVYYKTIFSDHFDKEIELRNEFFEQVGDQLTATTQSFQETANNDEGFGTFYPNLGLYLFNPSALTNVGLDNLQPTTSSDNFYDNTKTFYENISSFENVYLEDMVTNHYDAKIRRTEFNFSNNPTFSSGSEKSVLKEFQEDPVVYITKVGLYNDKNELLAVARPSRPIKKTFDNEVIVRCKIDM